MALSVEAKRELINRADWRCECDGSEGGCGHRYRCGRQLDWAADATGSIIAAWSAPKVVDMFGRHTAPPRYPVEFDEHSGRANPDPGPDGRVLCVDCHASVYVAAVAEPRSGEYAAAAR